MSKEVRPSWQVEHCPRWCTREHGEQDHPEDRYHQSEPSFAPILATSEPSVPATSSLEAVDMLVRVCRYDGDVVTWVAIEPTEQRTPRLVLTLESARLLVHQLTEQFRLHDA